ncbi:hypothetical protein [Acidisphaera sp. L21]|uniref:hypothetical protein n=1 Tax=Acidisphaera sp. L21 TaxID=1641851 RepID=UPI00131DFF85|nr:hypothetical protein [Acidisphaera sp. L21]
MPAKFIVLAAAGLALASPAMAQAPNPSQMLKGLLSGNQGQDQAVRDAFERGYQRGRQDQEVADRDRNPRGGGGGYDQRPYPQQQPVPYGR